VPELWRTNAETEERGGEMNEPKAEGRIYDPDKAGPPKSRTTLESAIEEAMLRMALDRVRGPYRAVVPEGWLPHQGHEPVVPVVPGVEIVVSVWGDVGYVEGRLGPTSPVVGAIALVAP
jgi:hypothetical protein